MALCRSFTPFFCSSKERPVEGPEESDRDIRFSILVVSSSFQAE